MARFATLGNVTIDDLVFDDGSTMWRTPGGNAIYSALGVAIWGYVPDVLAPIGPDYPTELLKARVRLGDCRPVPQTLRDWGLYEADGSRHFVFRRHVTDWRDFSPHVEDTETLSVDAAHIAPLPWDLQLELTRSLRERGTGTLSVDPDDRFLEGVTSGEMADLVRAVDLFLPSYQDAVAMLSGTDAAEMLRRLREMAPNTPVLAVKLGAKGVIVNGAGETDYYSIPSAAPEMVDATGAGDAFCGGALVGYHRTGRALDAGLHGSVAASYAVAAHGLGSLVAAEPDDRDRRLSDLAGRAEAHPL